MMRSLALLCSLVMAVFLAMEVGSVNSAQFDPPPPTPTPRLDLCTFEGSPYNFLASMQIIPIPTEQTETTLRIAGVSNDFCGPRYLRYERFADKITIYAYEPSYLASCGEAAAGWGFDINLGELAPGKYEARLVLECEGGAFTCGETTTVWVGMTPPLDHAVYLPHLMKSD